MKHVYSVYYVKRSVSIFSVCHVTFQQNEGDNGVKVLEVADPSKQVY